MSSPSNHNNKGHVHSSSTTQPSSNGSPYPMTFNPYLQKWTFVDGDGITYEYDDQKNAWFPVLNEDLLKMQQSVYAVAGVEVDEPSKEEEAQNHSRKRKKKEMDYTGASAAQDPSADTTTDQKRSKNNNPSEKSTRPRQNTAVYITGLPSDTTVEEIHTLFSKCGIILEDPVTLLPRIKLYKSPTGELKGDALVIYYKAESVPLAVSLLDETELRSGGDVIRVQPAVFQEKAEKVDEGKHNADDKKKQGKRSTVDKSMIRKTMSKLEKRLEWFDDEEISQKAQKVVVLKYMFTIGELEADPTLLLDLKEDVREECEKLGEVTNVTLFDLEPDGIMSVRFKDPQAALSCITLMNGRFFAGRKIEARLSTGKEKFKQSKVAESEEEEKKRLERYEAWLESQH